MNKSFVAIAALAVCAVSGQLSAQSTNDENKALLSQIQTDKRAIVLKGLELTASESAAFIPIYDEYEPSGSSSPIALSPCSTSSWPTTNR
jgi:hypothetical protein